MTPRESFIESLKKLKAIVDVMLPYLNNTDITENMIKWDMEKLVADNRQLKEDYELVKQARDIVKKEADELLAKAKSKIKDAEESHTKRMAEMQADRLNLQSTLDKIKGEIYHISKK
jgi:N-acetylmuramic acid 6-phosphate (MurNAc-6-P) etherase